VHTRLAGWREVTRFERSPAYFSLFGLFPSALSSFHFAALLNSGVPVFIVWVGAHTHEVISAHAVVGPELILHLPRKLRDALTESLLTLPLQFALLPSRPLLPSSFLPSYITPTLYSATDPPPATRFSYRFPCYPTLTQSR
jgi:hypothetical protein